MNELEKLLKKRKKEDRERLLETLAALKRGETKGLKIIKLTGSDMYRVRVGDFRIQFSINKKIVTIESVRLRNEATYK